MPSQGISIVIPAYNEEALLPATLRSVNEARLFLEREEGIASEVIVVNNASTDRTARVAIEHGALVLDHSERNIASVRNAGIRQAKYPLVVTIDADCLMPHKALRQLHEVFLDQRIVGVSLGLRVRADRLSQKILARLLIEAAGVFSGMFGGNFCFRREEALALGGFPERMLIGEDRGFAASMRNYGKLHGRKFILLREVQVETVDRKDLSWLSILALLGTLVRALASKEQDLEKLGFWYKPDR